MCSFSPSRSFQVNTGSVSEKMLFVSGSSVTLGAGKLNALFFAQSFSHRLFARHVGPGAL